MITNNTPYCDPSRFWISIIGMGAGGSRLFSNLVNAFTSSKSASAAVGFLLFDKRPEYEFGRGVAWGANQSDLFLANMRLNTIDFPKVLFDELKNNLGIDEWRDEELPEDIQFVSRKIIGEGLNRQYQSSRQIAEEAGIPVEVVSSNVTDVSRLGTGYMLKFTLNELDHEVFCQYVVLAVGNVPKRVLESHEDDDRYVQNPWRWDDYPDLKGKTVAILGTGPTAVDSTIHCLDKGANGVTMLSSSGTLQFPRPKNTPYAAKFFSGGMFESFVKANFGKFDYDLLRQLLMAEFALAGDKLGREDICADYNAAHRIAKEPVRKMLLGGTLLAAEESGWYSVLKSLDQHTPKIWNTLSTSGKHDYKQKLESEHNRMSFGMAYSHAKRLVDFIDNKKLSVVKFRLDTHSGSDSNFDFSTKEISINIGNTKKAFDVVINCLGIGSTQKDFRSKLVDSLILKGWLNELEDFGGFQVDFNTGQLLQTIDTAQRTIGNIYALTGSLTRGTHLLTNCISQLFVSCDRTGTAILDDVMNRIPAD